jgi:radical SAM superfamily enzyme YgiQ (UPF0313 family)
MPAAMPLAAPQATADPLHQFSAKPRHEKVFPPLGPGIKALMIWPRFPASFWGFEGVLDIIPERSMIPPLGLITVAALCPASWELRLLDLSFDELRDEDLLWADLVMISAMHAQRTDTVAVLDRARGLHRRTFIGGPWASSEPEFLLTRADHVMVGEAEEVFAGIAAALENGAAHALYKVIDKPALTESPVPRFELLKMSNYTSMPIQFSRGCPFQCEFCDIITIYGRKPRAKTPVQMIAELDRLRELGWRNEVFIVDDNFIGNSKLALALSKELALWQERNKRPVSFYTEASIDLADRPELMAAMVEANFMYVFLGIETPSLEALKGSSKFQNLRGDLVSNVEKIRAAGLWVLAGFIVGFDSDDETIFERQRLFIEKTAITWAMAGVLQAPPTTALYDRMKREGRLYEDSQATSNFSPPNFQTVMPLPTLLQGLSGLLADLYTPEAFFARALRSIEAWHPRKTQVPPSMPLSYNLHVFALSMWRQGVLSNYKLAYWRFLGKVVRRWAFDDAKLWLSVLVLLSANHFVIYSKEVAEELAAHVRDLEPLPPSPGPASHALAPAQSLSA